MANRQQLSLQGLSAAVGSSTAVGPSDLLEVIVDSGWQEEPVEPLLLRVDNSGHIGVPHVGKVRVVGLEPDQAAAQIVATAIQRDVYRRPAVTVTVSEQAFNRITVLGAVAEPGVHEVPRGASAVLTAVAAAGGLTEEAGQYVDVMRNGSPGAGLAQNQSALRGTDQDGEVKLASFAAPNTPSPISGPQRLDLADLKSTPAAVQRLSDQDVVFVPPREKRVIYVSGLVASPDQVELPDDSPLRVLDAIAMAGGITSPVADSVVVLRSVDDRPEPLVIAVSISGAKKIAAENLVLQAGDLVSVEQTPLTVAVDTVTQLFRVSMGLGGNLNLF